MLCYSEECEFVYCLFHYVLQRRGLFPHLLPSFSDEECSFSTPFSGQIGRTVLLLSDIFRETLSKWFRVILPRVLRSKKHFMAFLNSLLRKDENEDYEYLLKMLSVSAIITEFSIFAHFRGYENIITLTAECFIEILETRTTDFCNSGGWINLKIESIPFSRAYFVLQYLTEKGSDKIHTDRLLLVLDLVGSAFDSSTSDILQDAYGIYPLQLSFRESENSILHSGSSNYEGETALSDVTLINEEKVKENHELCHNEHLINSKSDYTTEHSDERHSVPRGSDDGFDGKQKPDFVIKYVSGSENANKTEYFSEAAGEAKVYYSNNNCRGRVPPLTSCFSPSPPNCNKNWERLLENLPSVNHEKHDVESPSELNLRDEKKLICSTEENKTKGEEIKHSVPSFYGVPNWKRRIVQLRKERSERKFTQRQQCKGEKCRNLQKKISGNKIQYFYIPESTETSSAEPIPLSHELDLQNYDAFSKQVISASTPSEDKENDQLIKAFECCQTGNIQIRHLASTSLTAKSFEAIKILTNVKLEMQARNKITKNFDHVLKDKNIAQKCVKLLEASYEFIAASECSNYHSFSDEKETTNDLSTSASQEKISKNKNNKCKRKHGKKKKR